jgi:hypothetical protein
MELRIGTERCVLQPFAGRFYNVTCGGGVLQLVPVNDAEADAVPPDVRAACPVSLLVATSVDSETTRAPRALYPVPLVPVATGLVAMAAFHVLAAVVVRGDDPAAGDTAAWQATFKEIDNCLRQVIGKQRGRHTAAATSALKLSQDLHSLAKSGKTVAAAPQVSGQCRSHAASAAVRSPLCPIMRAIKVDMCRTCANKYFVNRSLVPIYTLSDWLQTAARQPSSGRVLLKMAWVARYLCDAWKRAAEFAHLPLVLPQALPPPPSKWPETPPAPATLLRCVANGWLNPRARHPPGDNAEEWHTLCQLHRVGAVNIGTQTPSVPMLALVHRYPELPTHVFSEPHVRLAALLRRWPADDCRVFVDAEAPVGIEGLGVCASRLVHEPPLVPGAGPPGPTRVLVPDVASADPVVLVDQLTQWCLLGTRILLHLQCRDVPPAVRALMQHRPAALVTDGDPDDVLDAYPNTAAFEAVLARHMTVV